MDYKIPLDANLKVENCDEKYATGLDCLAKLTEDENQRLQFNFEFSVEEKYVTGLDCLAKLTEDEEQRLQFNFEFSAQEIPYSNEHQPEELNFNGNILEDQFSCYSCSFKCSVKQQLEHHVITHNSERYFVPKLLKVNVCQGNRLCPTCNCMTAPVRPNVETTNPKDICNVCGFKASSRADLVQHISSHTTEKPSLFSIHATKLTELSAGVNHFTICTDDRLSCTVCNFSKPTQTARECLGSHTVAKYSSQMRPYNTSRKFKLVLRKKKHIGKNFICSVCNYNGSCKYKLVRHLNTHTVKNPYSCNRCNFTARFKCYLVEHMQIHCDNKPFVCLFCDYKTHEKCFLNDHTKRHTEERRHVCSLCGYKAAYKSSIEKHVSTHHTERYFLCNLCDYKALKKMHIKLHLKYH